MKRYVMGLLLCLSITTVSSQVGVNTATPDPSAILDISSTETGLLIPRMNEGERLAIAIPAEGLLVYQTTSPDGFWFYNGTVWLPLINTGSGGADGWQLNGNIGTNATLNRLGTLSNQDFSVRTDNTEAIRFAANGNVGIGTDSPEAKLHIVGASEALRIIDTNQSDGFVLISDADGNATWQEAPVPTPGDDNDWIFASGSTISDPIYHEGSVTIGTANVSPYNLHIDSGDPTETSFRMGSIEVIRTRTNSFLFNQDFLPLDNNSITLGSPTRRWTAVWSINGTINTSDRRDKERIEASNYGLKEVLRLKPVSFQWKEERVDDFIVPDAEKKRHLGFIAQNIQEVLPEIVETHYWKEYEENPGVLVKEESPRLGVSYSELIPIIVKSIQEQQKKIEELKKLSSRLEQKIKKSIN